MSANEFAFLALGLILGVAAGAAIIVILRARPPSAREIRVTVTPDSIPRRATTLAANDLSTPVTSAARGGPGADASLPMSDPLRPHAGHVSTSAADPDRTGVQITPAPSRLATDMARGEYALTAPATREPFVLGPPLSSARALSAVQGGPASAAAQQSSIASTGIGVAQRGHPSSRVGSIGAGSLGGDAPEPGRGLVGIEIGPDPDRDVDRLDAGRSIAMASGRPSAAGGAPRGAFGDDGSLGQATGAVMARAGSAEPGGSGSPTSESGGADEGAGPTWAGSGDDAADEMDACAAQRRVADERCGTAKRLAGQADAAQASLREAQLTADQHQIRATEAASRADPRGIRVAKEAAQQAFRTSRAAATSREGIEAAARAWLQDINRINREAREATLTQRREQDATNALLGTIERLSVEADAARITAESAQAACLAARESLAACEEAATRARRSEEERRSIAAAASAGPGQAIEQPAGEAAELAPGGGAARPAVPVVGAAALLSDTQVPGLFRLLQGDRDTMRHIVDEISGGDPAERRRWQLQLSDLVDALLARAIESSILDFPTHHSFWGMFTRLESRDIAAALASLGYRFDGLGGFVDGRVPSQRDLSLAVGYAGLDPMRIRRWPGEADMPSLFSEVTVSADEYVASVAGNLTLGDLVTVLGRRADGLADLWNAWGRVRPLLLESSETQGAAGPQA